MSIYIFSLGLIAVFSLTSGFSIQTFKSFSSNKRSYQAYNLHRITLLQKQIPSYKSISLIYSSSTDEVPVVADVYSKVQDSEVQDSEVLDSEVVGSEGDSDELDLGGIENMEFTRLTRISPTIAKYRLEGFIKSKECNSYLEEYKAEMKRRKVKFPGFRVGFLPPFAMTDVRRYIVSYGLELNLGTLCNTNSLIMCTENGEDVPFGQDEYYTDIFINDSEGNNFMTQRDAWREGTDFKFAVEFFAKEGDAQGEEEEKGSE